MKKKQLKVYGGMLTNPNPPPDRPLHKRLERVVAAVTSQKELATLADAGSVGRVSLGYIQAYFCITGNAEELKLALSKPHQLIWTGRT